MEDPHLCQYPRPLKQVEAPSEAQVPEPTKEIEASMEDDSTVPTEEPSNLVSNDDLEVLESSLIEMERVSWYTDQLSAVGTILLTIFLWL